MATVKLKNVGSEALAFAGIPLIQPDETFEISEDQAKILLRNESIQLVASEKKTTAEKSFKGVEDAAE